MNQSRRNFIKKLPVAASIPFALSNIPVRVLGEENTLTQMAAAAGENRRLIILQMHGGNDGLNCVIPVEKYDQYYSIRPNIAIPSKNNARGYIPLDSTLPSDAQVGLHPDMQAMKALYDQGRMALVQGVSYKNNNGSHFRGRDIWYMGGSYNDYFQSGWVGRYLEGLYAPLGMEYPKDFPNPTMPDPLAIEMGTDVSLIFHQDGNIPTSIAIPTDPEGFGEFIDGLEGFDDIPATVDPRGIPPEYLNGSPYYKELKWILGLEDKTKSYAKRLSQQYLNGKNSDAGIVYPQKYPFNAPEGSQDNPLSRQLKVIANLLSGGCQTKIFLVKVGGFDTHADQVETYNPTMGSHAALMYHISTAMNAFQQDLRARGYENEVLTVTTSEFGRQVASNASYGTDHGTGAPLFIFGRGVQAGVVGTNPDLTKRTVEMQYDYREVFGSIMRDWMLVSDAQLEVIFPGLVTNGIHKGVEGQPFQTLPLAQRTITSSEGFISDRFRLEDCYPNPAKDTTTIVFHVNSAYNVTVDLYTQKGEKVKSLVNGLYPVGEHKIAVDLTGLPAGTYIYELKSGFFKEAKKLVITK
ncbi:DUF1501 domain-containing protein [Parachryseolinea silvisoli]|uniref:DUF1501 domain-containing protein n=1 Tax=Parachryseolinea silvisoli TaxID=2873601 RepID=UPI002265B6F0|nr:DUF1501 domain-containing protein [Parachryseolinea silvisoli]MCD9018385.1 DUF1501 domain-containing protein [Parachryseolinea silvisoli]